MIDAPRQEWSPARFHPSLRFIKSSYRLLASISPHVCQGWRKIWVVVTGPLPISLTPAGPKVTLTSHFTGRAHRIQPEEQRSGSSATAFAGCKKEFKDLFSVGCTNAADRQWYQPEQAMCDQPAGR